MVVVIDDQYKIPKLAITQWNTDNYKTIDVRSPKEFTEFALPNSVNIPIFNNQEREKVGTVYKRNGKDEAIKLGLKLFSEKIPFFYEAILKLKEEVPNKELVVVCARGGLRSSSLVSTLNMVGIHSFQLQGGIRSYREFIVAKLQKYTSRKKRFHVISGNTGTKKTAALHCLKREGYPVIDLEDLAGHRGSAFGKIGMKAKSQKQFEALLVNELERFDTSAYFIIEAESKRIGNIVLPDFILSGKKSGVRIELEAPLEERVNHLLETYQPAKHHQEILEAFQIIKKRMQGHIGIEIEQLLLTEDYETAFEMLLTNYYDPKYTYTALQKTQITHHLTVTNLSETIEEIKNIISSSEIQQRIK